MPNYQNSKIYTIRSHQTDQIYVGSTTISLSKRFSKHKMMRCTSRYILKYDDAYIELLEEFPCDNKEQLLRREGQHIRENNCVNKIIAGRTKKEYRQDNKDNIKDKTKQYRENNKDKIKEYREDNKDKLNKKKREYYNKNKDSRICVCGASYNYGAKGDREKHYESIKHNKWQQDFYIRLEEMLA